MIPPHQEELTALAGDILDTIEREDVKKSFQKTGRTVRKTTARKVCVDHLLLVKPVQYLKNRGEY